MSKHRCQIETSSTDFVLWQEFLIQEVNEFNPLYHYLAQICAVIQQGQVKKGVTVKIADFILKFTRKFTRAIPEQHLTNEQRAARSRSIWLGMSGYTKLQKDKERKIKLQKATQKRRKRFARQRLGK